MSKLKPCPFCNGKANTFEWGISPTFSIGCESCQATVSFNIEDKNKAIKTWNTRPEEPLCPCGGVIYANTEDWKVPVCYECYEEIREYFKDSNDE